MFHDVYTPTDQYLLTLEAIQLTKTVFLPYEDQESNKRMFLAIRAISAVKLSLQQDPDFENVIRNLRIYFTGTGDAYLSVYEVRSVLYVCLILTKNLKFFDLFCQEFDKLMPECPAKMELRKLPNLTQLARRQIWRNLSSSKLPLSTAVEKLNLPKSIKSYLSGEVFDISRNVSSDKAVTQSELALMLFNRTTF